MSAAGAYTLLHCNQNQREAQATMTSDLGIAFLRFKPALILDDGLLR